MSTVLGELEIAITENVVTCQCFGGDAYVRCKFWKGTPHRECTNTEECNQKIFPHWTLANLTPMQKRRTRYNWDDLDRLAKIIKAKERLK